MDANAVDTGQFYAAGQDCAAQYDEPDCWCSSFEDLLSGPDSYREMQKVRHNQIKFASGVIAAALVVNNKIMRLARGGAPDPVELHRDD